MEKKETRGKVALRRGRS